MCILNHPVPGTDDAPSAQIILPQKQLNRKHDVYVGCCSYRCVRDCRCRNPLRLLQGLLVALPHTLLPPLSFQQAGPS